MTDMGPLRDNDVSALVPEHWAREALRNLDKQTKILPLVNRNYENFFAEEGDVVNINRDGNFVAKRKFQGQAITIQDVKSTKDWVRLNQQLHVSFLIDDQDLRRTFKELVPRYMLRAAVALGLGVDAVLMGEGYQFLDYAAGHIGTPINDAAVLDLREHFQRNEVPVTDPRYLIVGAAAEKQLLDVPRFVDSDKLMSNGEAIRNGQIGRVRGFEVITASQAWEVEDGNDQYAGAINHTGGYLKGATVLTVDQFSSEAVVAGSWCLIAGDDKPHRITARTLDTGSTVEITITPGLFNAVADNAIVNVWRPFYVNQASATAQQASGYDFQSGEDMVIDGWTNGPMLGQGVTVGNTADVYTVTGVDLDNNKITLNRPLDVGVLNDVGIFPLPRGNYNMAFIRDALTFVNRPLMPPDAGTGVRSYTANYRGVAIRVTFGYDMIYERMRVTFSTLCGVKTLDKRMGGMLVS